VLQLVNRSARSLEAFIFGATQHNEPGFMHVDACQALAGPALVDVEPAFAALAVHEGA